MSVRVRKFKGICVEGIIPQDGRKPHVRDWLAYS